MQDPLNVGATMTSEWVSSPANCRLESHAVEENHLILPRFSLHLDITVELDSCLLQQVSLQYEWRRQQSGQKGAQKAEFVSGLNRGLFVTTERSLYVCVFHFELVFHKKLQLILKKNELKICLLEIPCFS